MADAQAQITAEQNARASADEALTSSVVAQESRLGDAEAGIVELAATRVTAAGAVAAVTTEISASYGDLTALAEATAFAEATLDGITTGFVWKLGDGDVLSLVRVDDGITEPVTTARIRSDFIRLDGNVEVTGEFLADKIFAEEILVERLTVTDELIAPNATGAISAVTLQDPVGISSTTAFEDVLTLTAQHSNLPTSRHMIVTVRYQAVSLSPSDDGADVEYRVLRNGVVMENTIDYRYRIESGRRQIVDSLVFKNRTTPNASSTEYTLQARYWSHPGGPKGVVVLQGTQIFAEEKAIATFA